MDATEALEFRLSCTAVEPNRCQGCGTETDYLLCTKCLHEDKHPTWRIQECIGCGKRERVPWEAKGQVYCGQTACFIEASDRMASFLISDTRRGERETKFTTRVGLSSNSEGSVRHRPALHISQDGGGTQP